MSDNYASPLLTSNNTFSYNNSNNHVVNPIYSDKNKSHSWCDKSCIGCSSLFMFVFCIVLLLIIHFS